MNRCDNANHEDDPQEVPEMEPYDEDEINDLFNKWEQDRQPPRRSWGRR